MNDEWSRCPICFEEYSLAHRPTTFVCGHSTCIDHTSGPQRLRYCPICRCDLKHDEGYRVSYNLEEASRLFQLIKDTIDWSTIQLSSPPIVNDNQNSTVGMIHRDEVYARRLQAELNHDTVNTPRRRSQPRPVNETLSAIEIPITSLPVPERNQSSNYEKRCGHRCDLVSTRRCCTCSDQRPQRRNNAYKTYVDGRGMVDRAARNEFYCPTCKAQ